jgi:hypothetical protein
MIENHPTDSPLSLSLTCSIEGDMLHNHRAPIQSSQFSKWLHSASGRAAGSGFLEYSHNRDNGMCGSMTDRNNNIAKPRKA